jgi:hypothetical protein
VVDSFVSSTPYSLPSVDKEKFELLRMLDDVLNVLSIRRPLPAVSLRLPLDSKKISARDIRDIKGEGLLERLYPTRNILCILITWRKSMQLPMGILHRSRST